MSLSPPPSLCYPTNQQNQNRIENPIPTIQMVSNNQIGYHGHSFSMQPLHSVYHSGGQQQMLRPQNSVKEVE